MRRSRSATPLAILGLVAGCATASSIEGAKARREQARPAIAALAAGSFEEARRTSDELLGRAPDHAEARFVRAVARYRARIDQMGMDIRTLIVGTIAMGRLNTAYLRQALEGTASELAGIDEDLAIAAGAPYFEVELCPACWRTDWNQSGEVDSGDERLLEVETDRTGMSLPDGDPRRRPTFAFDRGDLFWARAILSHQRALVELLLAYEVEDLSGLLRGGGSIELHVKVADGARVGRAKELFLSGLAFGDRARQEYLAEIDDHAEWVPSPRQKDHAVPLEVDEALYEKWRLVLEDLARLIRGEQGLELAELFRALHAKERELPHGYLDVGRWFRDPRDFTIALDKNGDPEAELKKLLGESWRPSMEPSPILKRVEGLEGAAIGPDFWEKKLKYVLWMN